MNDNGTRSRRQSEAEAESVTSSIDMRPELLEAMRSGNAILHARAWDMLKRSFYLSPSASGGRPFHGMPRFCLWNNPGGLVSDELQPFTLTVFELYGEHLSRHPVVREAVWRRHDDLTKLRRKVEQKRKVIFCEPTLIVRDGPVPAAEFAAMLEEATQFRVPVVWFGIEGRESVTTDVGAVGFEFFSHEQPPARLRLEWSCEIPEEWRPIAEWRQRMEKFLLDCLPPRSSPQDPSGSD